MHILMHNRLIVSQSRSQIGRLGIILFNIMQIILQDRSIGITFGSLAGRQIVCWFHWQMLTEGRQAGARIWQAGRQVDC